MRILVTGSRDWDDHEVIYEALWEQYLWLAKGLREPATLVSGACPTGADRIAETIAETYGLTVERHPVEPEDWEKYGRKAGPMRNAHMVSLGADICLAFIGDCTSPRCTRTDRHPSHGASGCADLAEKAGIPTKRHYADEPE